MAASTTRRSYFGNSFEVALRNLANDPDAIPKPLLDLSKFYQERIETIRTRLWATLTWLAAVQGGALILTVKEGGLRTGKGPVIVLEHPLLVTLLAVLSCLFALYMMLVALNGMRHIKNNYRYSNMSLGIQSRSARGELAFKLMVVLAVFSFLIAAGIAYLGSAGIYEWWSGEDISWIQLVPHTPAKSDG